jgi:outer membrane protein
VVRIRANNVEVLTRQLQAARDRFEVGEITRTDVAQAEARLSAGEAGLAGARAQLEASRANYAQVVGASPGSLTPPPPAPALPEAFDVAVETALAANPDYLRLKAAERAAVQQVRIDQSSLLPSVSVVGRADRAFDQGIRGAESEGLSATAQVSVPLFDAGILRSRVRQSKTVLDRARSQTEETRRAVVANVSDAWNGHTAARRQVEASRKQESAAKLALEGAEQELQVGLRTTLDVLNAQQEFLEAQLAVVSAERNAYVAAHALLQSVGALDAQTLGVNAPLYDPNEHKRAARRAILANDPSGKP